MSPVISLQPREEPTIPVTVQGREHAFMVDTGATYSCIGKNGFNLPLSSSSIRTVGFSGKTQVIPLTEPLTMQIEGKTIVAPLLYSAHTPINLLGRDILCILKANIVCTQRGLQIEFHEGPSANQMMPVMVGKELQNGLSPLMNVTAQDHHSRTPPLAYWLQLAPQESSLIQLWEEWEPWVQALVGKPRPQQMPLHCTLLYDEHQNYTDYADCWMELINKKQYSIISQDIFVGPEGAAAAVTLPPELREWYHVQNSAPHVPLMTTEGHRSSELGPMIKAASQVLDWRPTNNKYLHISPDARFHRISARNYNVGTAEIVVVNVKTPSHQCPLSEHEDVLGQVPPSLWSKHKTDVGFIRAADPIHIKVKKGARLPYQRQYPLRQHAIDGIRPTIRGLVDAGVLIETKSSCNTPIFPIKKPHSNDYRLVHDLRAINSIVDVPKAIVPDPHTLLSNIPPGTKWYTVIDLCSAFFSVPLHTDSQYLFAFTFEGKQMTYPRLPQGFLDSPAVFNRVLAQDLQNLHVTSTVLQYVDDILICSSSKEQCQTDWLRGDTVCTRAHHSKVQHSKPSN
ncbi:uncharacterized protein LOC124479489 [Hypomesus transpacificus]|uniref:uncharacterized protein LOC124479489 n=1 Tax=Hypomesus transpacificus TaxID=137520 RepID=UPI001F07DDB9|nr:uncharacterized protein LOC124479489 [Hypomesus transpacificus]